MAFNFFKKKAAADVLFTGGSVITLNPDEPQAEAVAVKDGVVLAVGDADALEDLAGKHTQVVDLEGGCLVPGFFDSDGQLARNTFAPFALALNPAMSIAQITDALAIHIAENPDLEQYIAFGYSEFLFAEEEAAQAVRSILDPISPEKPLLLVSDQGLQALLNTAALQKIYDTVKAQVEQMEAAAGGQAFADEEEDDDAPVWTPSEKDPWPLLKDSLPGYQYYHRDSDGIITGCAEGVGLTGWLLALLEPFDLEDLAEAAFDACRAAAKAGCTSVLESGSPDYMSRAFLSLLITQMQTGSPLLRWHSATLHNRETDVYLALKRLPLKETQCTELTDFLQAKALRFDVFVTEEGKPSLSKEFMGDYAAQAADHGSDIIISAEGFAAAEEALAALLSARAASKKARLSLQVSGLSRAEEDKLEASCQEEDIAFLAPLPAPGSLPRNPETAEALLDALCGRLPQMIRGAEKHGVIVKGAPADFTLLEYSPLASGHDPRTIPVLGTFLGGNPVSLDAPADDEEDWDDWETEEDDEE